MANRHRQSLDNTFFALGDATRRGMLVRLARGETSLSEFAADFAVSLPTIHKHLHVLERAQLVSHEKRGRLRLVRLARTGGRKGSGRPRAQCSALLEVKAWMAQLEARWDEHLLRLKKQVEADL